MKAAAGLLVALAGCIAAEPPTFPSALYQTSVSEGPLARNQTFFSVKLNNGSGAKYAMTSLIDSRSQRMFAIDEDSGDISTVSELDREFMSVHYFKVTGVVEPRATATATLQISVRDVNDNAPQFESAAYNATVRESLPIGTSLVTVRASDPDADENGRVTYSLLASDIFRIDPNSGVVTLRASLDRENKSEHAITVVARDNAAPASERLEANATILVRLIDDNDNVPFFTRRIYYLDVREDANAAERPKVGQVVAMDLDDGENAVVKYSIIGGNTGGAFAVDPEDGSLFLQRAIDREKQDAYKLIVRAQDIGDPPKSNTTQVVINVLDVNDNEPRFPSTNYYQSVAENVPEGYSILQLTAYDPDQGANANVDYSLREPNPDLPFDIDSSTGWIRTSKSLDREMAQSYRFYVEAKDQGTPKSRSAIATVQISVLDRNDNDPVMSQRSYDVEVSESEPLGREILKVIATDPDENEEIRYEIVGGNTAHAFSISSRQSVGIISIAQPLDFNKDKVYRLSVNAVDSGGRFATAAVNINVTDSNNHAPIFENTPYVVDVFEDTPIGSTVLVLYATDLDHGPNAKINYRLQSGSEHFQVERDSGALVVASPIDRESISTFIVTVIAEDSGLAPLSDRTEVEITVIDVNDNAPRFSSSHYHGSVLENAASGTSILDISAHDEDLGENGKVRYRFAEANQEQSFTIDSVSGVVRTKRPLDREATEFYDLTVEAYDAGIPEMVAIVKVGITVLDLNDNPPRFPNDTIVFRFPENMPSGSKVGTIYATDPDVGVNAQVRFRLLNTTADEQYFFIDDSSASGSTVLYTRKEFDYEVDRRDYHLLLRAESDPLRTDVVVRVQLADVNDNYPIIQDFEIIFNQAIDEYFAEPLGFVPASDADPTSKLQFNFTYGNAAHLLHLDSSTGAIRFAPSLKSNVNVEAKVGVSVTDGKNEARANFRLKLNHVTAKMLENAVTVRVANTTADSFLAPFFDYLVEGLSVVVPCHKSQISVFSLKNDSEDETKSVVNVTFSISVAGTHSEEYLAADYIKQRIYLHKPLLEKLLLLSILPFDDNICVREPCLNYEVCSSQMRIAAAADHSTSYKSDGLLFRSVDTLITYSCTCPVGFTGMKNRYTCDTKINLCYSSPCQNGATCVSRENGYVCLCPEGLAGDSCEVDTRHATRCSSSLCHKPAQCVALIDGGLTCRNCSDNPFNDDKCQLRARSFTPGSYAAFPALKQRDEFNITLFFATQKPSGVIFYNGRLNDENDFISLEVNHELLVFRFHTGSPDEAPAQVSLARKGGFSDGQFHRVEIRYSNESATLVVGQGCDEKLALKFGHDLTDKYLCANSTKVVRVPSQCGFYSGRCVRFLDLTGPFLIGGRMDNGGFAGCLLDLHIDRLLVNMANLVHNNGSIAGCPEKRNFCISNPCRNGGTCHDGWGSYFCECASSQWSGKNCGFPVGRTFGFKAGSELGYRQELSPIQLPWQMGLSLKTADAQANFTLLSVKMGNEEAYRIEVHSGIVKYFYENQVLLTSGLLNVADEKWHDIQVKWMKDEVWLNIDFGQYEVTEHSINTVGGKVVTKVTVGNAQDKINFLVGCVRNIQIGIESAESPELSYEKAIESCPSVCEGKTCGPESRCKGPGCFCPLKGGCLDDPCSLNLCSSKAACRSTSDGYECSCEESDDPVDQYCTKKVEEEVCPSHWWGRPVCGPCQCNVSQGFNESCAIDSGKCSCKANHFVKGGKCQPCECYSYGALSPQCDLETGACSCRPGVSGHKCDKCSHGFAELASNGCQVIYGVCPAEYADGVWWPRTLFGDKPNATCPGGAAGVARRGCEQTGWMASDLTGCIHQEFLYLANEVESKTQESWVLAKKAHETVDEVTTDLFRKDYESVEAAIFKMVEQESVSVGFELAHKKDRQFLEHFLAAVSWALERQHTTGLALTDVHVMAVMAAYGGVLVRSMENTFTNPFEVVTDNVVFGLDQFGAAASRSRLARRSDDITQPPEMVAQVPKYNNYIKRTNSWSEAHAQLVTRDDLTRFQYAIYKTNKSSVDRDLLLVPGLLWATHIYIFSDIFSITFEAEESSVQSIVFHDSLKSATNRLHCVLWDRDLWNAIDCETATSGEQLAKVTVNCSCSSAVAGRMIVAVLEESITLGHDYLTSRLDSIVFSVCSSLSLAILLLTAGCLVMLNSRRKTSIRIHRNIVFCFLATQILVLVVVLANTQLTALSFACTFITMALHYFCVATFVWIGVESVHVFRMLSELRDINHGRTTFYSAAGFGLPGLVVGLTMGVSGSNYGSSAFCWLPYSHSSVWGMLAPEVLCASLHIVTMMLNLRTVFRVKSDMEDFASLRIVFFLNACLLPLVTGFHASALILINDRGATALFAYAGIAVVLALYLLVGYVICDRAIMGALGKCTGNSKRVPPVDRVGSGSMPMATHQISRSSLSYGQRGKPFNHPNNLDAPGPEVSVASTTSQSTYQTSSKLKYPTLMDEPDSQQRYYQGSDSESDIDRRSLDLASSHSSDEDFDNNLFDPSDLTHLSVNDYPQF